MIGDSSTAFLYLRLGVVVELDEIEFGRKSFSEAELAQANVKSRRTGTNP